jgi:hypothetical protein
VKNTFQIKILIFMFSLAFNMSRYSQGTTVYQSYLKCYCAACNFGCGNKASTEPEFCQAYFDNEQRLLLLTMVSVGGVVVINQVRVSVSVCCMYGLLFGICSSSSCPARVSTSFQSCEKTPFYHGYPKFSHVCDFFVFQTIKSILVVLANVEKKHTSNDRDASLANNVFVAQFMNTALINLLINADLRYYFTILEPLGPDGYNILTGTQRDFESSWYMLVGAQLILTVLTASVSPNIAELAKWPIALLKQRLMTNRVLTQTQMNKLYQGPDVVLSERYGALLSVLFVVMLYSAGMPLINFFAVVYFSLAYWCDKATLLMVSKRPGSIDSTLVIRINMFYKNLR